MRKILENDLIPGSKILDTKLAKNWKKWNKNAKNLGEKIKWINNN